MHSLDASFWFILDTLPRRIASTQPSDTSTKTQKTEKIAKEVKNKEEKRQKSRE
jgi:hypothetical protein